jgi:hypothetical protein
MSIETAAMEKILADLYKATQAQGKAQAAAFEKLAKASGLDPKIVKQTNDNVKDLGNSSGDAAESTGKLARAGNLVGSVLADLVGGVAATTGNLVKFGFSTLSGTAKMSDLIGAFKDLPIIGTVVGLFASLQKIQEQNLNMYRSLSASGINFGTGLQALQGDFLKLGLTSEEYVKTLTSNTDIFTLMGGSVTKGARNFVTLNKSLLDNHSELLSLGFSYQELSNVVTSFARVTGGLTKQQQQDTKGTADSMAAYAKEIDLLARLSGESREATQKKLEAEQQEASWQAFLSTLPKDLKDAHQKGLAIAQASGVAGAADIYKASTLGMTAVSDAAGLAYSMQSDGVAAINDMVGKIKSGTLTATELNRTFAQRVGSMQFQATQGLKDMGIEFIAVLSQAGVKFDGAFDPALANMARFNNENVDTHEAAMQRAMEAQAQQDLAAKQKNAEIQAQLESERVIRNLAYTISVALIPVVTGLLVPALGWLAENTTQVTKWVKKFGEELEIWVPRLFSEEGRAKIIDALADGFIKILELVKNKIVNSETYKDAANTASSAAEGFGKGAIVAGIALGIAAIAGVPLSGGASLGLLGATGVAGALFNSRESTTLGATGRPFENFGSGTPVMGHNIEGMFKPEQISSLITNSRAETMAMAVELLNNNNNQMISVLREINENTRRNVEATRTMNNAFG